eukprot:1153761-Pelagomonas_calceolata.AAC.1
MNAEYRRDEPCGLQVFARKEKKNYVGRVTLPTSIKEKETRWLIKSRELPPSREKKERQN